MERIRQFLRERQVELIIGGLIFSFLLLFFGPDIFITIKAGEAGVLYRRFFGGTVRDKVFGEGLHVICPWDKLQVYNIRVQEKQHKLDVMDKTGLQFHLDISIQYHPDYDALALLHQLVGPDYLQKVVVPSVEGVLRSTAGTLETQELYANENGTLAKIVNQSLSKIGEKFVTIDDVIIRNIEFPEPIRMAIQKKREEEQLAEAYVYRLQREEDESKRKLLEAKGTKEANEVVNASLNSNILKWKGIEATMSLATSTNSKVIVIGNGPQGLPIILGSDK